MDIQWIDTEEKGWETSRQRRHIGSRHGNRQQSTTILPRTHNDLEMIFIKRELLIFMSQARGKAGSGWSADHPEF